ncbi:hypothetical protein V4Y02_23870, partial [Escherichia coli]
KGLVLKADLQCLAFSQGKKQCHRVTLLALEKVQSLQGTSADGVSVSSQGTLDRQDSEPLNREEGRWRTAL